MEDNINRICTHIWNVDIITFYHWWTGTQLTAELQSLPTYAYVDEKFDLMQKNFPCFWHGLDSDNRKKFVDWIEHSPYLKSKKNH